MDNAPNYLDGCVIQKRKNSKLKLYKLTRTGLMATAAAAANNEMAAKGATNRAKGLMPPPPRIRKSKRMLKLLEFFEAHILFDIGK